MELMTVARFDHHGVRDMDNPPTADLNKLNETIILNLG